MNVRTGSGDAAAMSATTIAESMPPERSAPSGTSDDEPLAHRGGHVGADALEPLLVARDLTLGDLRLPVALDVLAARSRRRAATRARAAARRQPRPRARARTEREVGVERGEIGLGAEPGKPAERLQLRRERDGAVRERRPDERLLAEPVAGEHEPLSRGVPERDREHAVEPLDEPHAVLLVEVGDDRRVAAAAHLVPRESSSRSSAKL